MHLVVPFLLIPGKQALLFLPLSKEKVEALLHESFQARQSPLLLWRALSFAALYDCMCHPIG